MKVYRFKFEHNLPIPLAEAWDFFSSPLNLSKITPAKMNFIITSDFSADTKMYPGMLISYKVSPVFGIKLNWVTEITHVKEHVYFVDEQRTGPYAMWHHEHHFKEIKGGVQMTDILTYGIPYGIIGRLANTILVEKEIKEVFNFREKEINKLFGVYKER
ncbi:ligand-binding SRPBCC domain-containing protein [Mucilaginibacter gracilis]|uniref:Ligand-binding SRPBCC domain-containing protein n=1 Tax=Mucilaginibacter gracilis TaxID=423350 RepID=A0A495J0A5_9SPHI|nr:SRPBCC family protein [Mucilaginibacter gracilis]RKR82203.1 ligand-binding SRPBCC domain-containing protein [Mucilaginibacter gracilis]